MSHKSFTIDYTYDIKSLLEKVYFMYYRLRLELGEESKGRAKTMKMFQKPKMYM